MVICPLASAAPSFLPVYASSKTLGARVFLGRYRKQNGECFELETHFRHLRPSPKISKALFSDRERQLTLSLDVASSLRYSRLNSTRNRRIVCRFTENHRSRRAWKGENVRGSN